MTKEEGLLEWQWRDYSRCHHDRVNLLVHMVTVPAFLGGMLAAVTQALHRQWFGAAVSVAFSLLAYGVQRLSQRRERVAVEPSANIVDFVACMFAEQCVTFPRFVLTGGWMRNLTQS